ncbi:MAG: hypothetical protein KIT09_05710 [Bryobacteraceae bacterium]|nr:hypothetical protein [Bryobacteraceae bacterium]
MKTVALSFCAVLLFAAMLAGQPPAIGSCPVFPADYVWNTPIDKLPVDSNSNAYVESIGISARLKADFGAGLWNGGPIGIPFIAVPGSQAWYPATFLYRDESDPGPYAVPLTAPIEGGSQSDGDRHAISIDTGNCVLYELYRAFPQSASWKADSGAIFDLRSHKLRPAGWTSADAAGLPIFAGLVRYEEILAGEIRHAIRFTAPRTRSAYIWPARHKASSLTGSQYPPMGQRFRLKAGVDISKFSATNQVILRALKKYGMILADNGSAWYMSGAPDSRWNNDDLHQLGNVLGSAFEAVDESSLMIDANSAQARQSGVAVTVGPASATLLTGAFAGFTATVSGAANPSVTWLVNGVAGGSAALGWIDANGTYQAPLAVPSPSTVRVQARSAADPGAVGGADVTIVAPPAIASVSPSPIPVGSFTLTINGAGFQKGAVVRLNGVALATTFVSAARLTAAGKAAAANPSVPVSVKNPDGNVSNTVTVAVVNAPVTVSVTPTSATVKVRRTAQFTAAVRNTSNKAVVWKVNGVTGGSAATGTITSGGLYTAPGTAGTFRITAVSKAAPSVSGSATAVVKR